MAVLLHIESSQRLALHARTVVGRSRRAHLRDDSMRMSGEHALISWTGSAWELRDLGSRNGTWANGGRIKAGERVSLEVGATLSFGKEGAEWRLESITPPAPLATDGVVWVEGEVDLLGLPDLSEPEVLIEQTGRGWVCQDELLRDGQVIQAAGRSWVLHLPEQLLPTADAGEQGLDDLELRFAVSSDEEYIEVTAVIGGRAQKLSPRSYHELLLQLARQRLEDARDATVSASEHGWMYNSGLERALRASSNQIYVAIHRIRREITGLGLIDGHDIIERRATSRQVRIGVARLQVTGLG